MPGKVAMLKEKRKKALPAKKKVGLRNWQDVIEEPFPELGSVTEKIREAILRRRHRIRGGVRLYTGRILTDERREERAKYIKKHL